MSELEKRILAVQDLRKGLNAVGSWDEIDAVRGFLGSNQLEKDGKYKEMNGEGLEVTMKSVVECGEFLKIAVSGAGTDPCTIQIQESMKKHQSFCHDANVLTEAIVFRSLRILQLHKQCLDQIAQKQGNEAKLSMEQCAKAIEPLKEHVQDMVLKADEVHKSVAEALIQTKRGEVKAAEYLKQILAETEEAQAVREQIESLQESERKQFEDIKDDEFKKMKTLSKETRRYKRVKRWGAFCSFGTAKAPSKAHLKKLKADLNILHEIRSEMFQQTMETNDRMIANLSNLERLGGKDGLGGETSGKASAVLALELAIVQLGKVKSSLSQLKSWFEKSQSGIFLDDLELEDMEDMEDPEEEEEEDITDLLIAVTLSAKKFAVIGKCSLIAHDGMKEACKNVDQAFTTLPDGITVPDEIKGKVSKHIQNLQEENKRIAAQKERDERLQELEDRKIQNAMG